MNETYNLMFRTLLCFLTLSFFIISDINAQLIRTIDGSQNNIFNPTWGSFHSELATTVSVGFADGVSQPAGADRPNPRIISNSIFAQSELLPDPLKLSDFVWVFGQFLDHDITLVHNSAVETANIPVNFHDLHFNPGNMHDNVMIRMNRSEVYPGSGVNIYNPRKFTNSITHWIDASNVYGSTQERADYLRTFENGKLKVSANNLLPYNTDNNEADGQIDPSVPHMDNENPFNSLLFVAGDLRANEQPLLAAFHTLFVREHNRLCDEIIIEHPDWTDEEIYQRARKLVGGFLQAITYNEWLPSIGIEMPSYTAYDPTVYPNCSNVFSAAAFRIGHTLLNSNLQMMDLDGSDMGTVTLAEAFFNPGLLAEHGLNPWLKGMAKQVEQNMDAKVVDEVRNFLFGPPQLGMGGLDLAAINIQRGRERGLPDFNTIREDLGLPRYNSFSAITQDQELATILAGLYHTVDNIDAWVGMLAENHMDNSIFGETVLTILKNQFLVLRDGDRFFYKNDPLLTNADRQLIDNTTFKDIIVRNTDIELMQSNVFKAMEHDSICFAGEPALPIFGQVTTFAGSPMEDVEIHLVNNDHTVLGTDVSVATGDFYFSDNSTCNAYYVSSSMENSNLREGLNSLDLVLMIRHFIRSNPFYTPYQHIAADVNNDKRLSVEDVLHLQDVLLYREPTFTNNTSWRFIPSQYEFENELAPLTEDIPTYDFINLSELNMQTGFIGVKTGDVSGNAVGEVRSDKELVFEIEDVELKKGETLTIPFRAIGFENINAYQFTLNLDFEKVNVQAIEAIGLERLNEKSFAQLEQEDAITSVWYNVNPVSKEENEAIFNLVLQARTDGKLSDLMDISSSLTPALAFNEEGEKMDVKLRFNATLPTPVSGTFELYQNTPNPFASQTTIGFNIPENSPVVLSFFSLNGSLLYQKAMNLDKGYHSIEIEDKYLGQTGMIYYQLKTKNGTLTKKMTRIN